MLMVMVAPSPGIASARVVMVAANMHADSDAADMGSDADAGIRRCCTHKSRRKNRNDQFLHGRVPGCLKQDYSFKMHLRVTAPICALPSPAEVKR